MPGCVCTCTMPSLWQGLSMGKLVTVNLEIFVYKNFYNKISVLKLFVAWLPYEIIYTTKFF